MGRSMQRVSGISSIALALVIGLSGTSAALAQSKKDTRSAALQGLVPVSALTNSSAGNAALATNFAVTGDIQDGNARQPTLLPRGQQQQQALRDAFITAGNAYQLADGLGTKLGGAYQSLTRYDSSDDGKTSTFTNVAPSVANVIAYALATTGTDSGTGKFFFANLTSNGKKPVSDELKTIMTAVQGRPDIFGRAYGLPAGAKGADPFGNSRPFMTEPHLITFSGPDFFGQASGNKAYLYGPAQDLTASPSYPSGHTTYGYTEALLLALMVPERYPQMIVRAADYGNNRIVLGAHYTMDVIGGRTLATYDIAHLLANKPGYVGVKRHKDEIDDFPKALGLAKADLRKALEAACGASVPTCAKQDQSRFANANRDKAFIATTQTYGLAVVYPANAHAKEDVNKLAPEAGLLLTTAFPYLSLAKADAILTETEGPGGGFLDNGSAFGVYSRLDLYSAALKAMAAKPRP